MGVLRPDRLVYLNLHGVGAAPRPLDAGERDCWLELSLVNDILDVVKDHAHVRLTVDDGNVSDHEHLLPALLDRRLKAEFFLCSERLDRPNFLSRTQVRELLAHGMTVGSHGAAHLPWRGLPRPRLQHELADSRKALEDALQARIDSAACPFGSYDRHVLAGLRAAGYAFVFTSDGGFADESEWLRARTTLTRSLSLEAVRELVTLGPRPLRRTRIAFARFVKRHLW